ncbi:hypothetical protein PYW08_012104 [Mythimna loreyi]|uniref:Uncharacterized protein n=1 Tax=Mythimna loreyi TaxID=667449 RepID=A0ACC2PZP8_9NEOP|nr:hypothetical protein PYW08_012104 [Mythimna loreyi]
MLFLLLNLLFLCELLRCHEFKPANSEVPPQNRQEHEAISGNILKNQTITDALMNSTPRTAETIHFTTQDSFLNASLGNVASLLTLAPLGNVASLLTSSSPLANRSSVLSSDHRKSVNLLIFASNSPPASVNPTTSTVKVSPASKNATGSLGTSKSCASASDATKKSCSSPSSYPAYTPPMNFDPSVAEIAQKWLEGIAITASTPKKRIPKLTLVFDYDFHTTQKLPHDMRRNRNPQEKDSNTQERDRSVKAQNSKRRPPKPDTLTFWHDPPKEPALERTKDQQTVTTATKKRLMPDLLLGKATISGIKNKDVTEYEDADLGRPDSQVMLRMHQIVKVTKKQWFSDRTKESKRAGTDAPTSKKHHRKILVSAPSTTSFKSTTRASTTKAALRTTKARLTTTKARLTTSEARLRTSEARLRTSEARLRTSEARLRTSEVRLTTSEARLTTSEARLTSKKETEELHPDTYMIIFVMGLTKLIATKDEKVVYDVIKHADQILHSVYKSRQFQWVSRPLVHFTKMITKSLKESKTRLIQKQAADLYLMLRQRRQSLSEEVNTIMEFADQLYSDDEDELLLNVLREFAAFPNITLNGYWLCNNLINTFLRPFRRLTDPKQRQLLMDAVDLALKTSSAPTGSNETDALRIGGKKPADVPPQGPKTITQKPVSKVPIRMPRQRKRKRRHRSHKRKRGRKRQWIQRTRPQRQYTAKENVMLRSVTPRMSVYLT